MKNIYLLIGMVLLLTGCGESDTRTPIGTQLPPEPSEVYFFPAVDRYSALPYIFVNTTYEVMINDNYHGKVEASYNKTIINFTTGNTLKAIVSAKDNKCNVTSTVVNLGITQAIEQVYPKLECENSYTLRLYIDGILVRAENETIRNLLSRINFKIYSKNDYAYLLGCTTIPYTAFFDVSIDNTFTENFEYSFGDKQFYMKGKRGSNEYDFIFRSFEGRTIDTYMECQIQDLSPVYFYN